MTIDFDKVADEIAEEGIDDDALTNLAKLCKLQIQIEDELDAVAERVKELNARLNQVSGVDIPSILSQRGLSEVRLDDGTKVKIRDEWRVGTTGKYRSFINNWLEKNGFGGMIRDEVTLRFGKDEGEKVEEFLKLAEKYTKSLKRVRAANATSFKSFVKELVEKGEIDVPLRDLGVHIQQMTKLERP